MRTGSNQTLCAQLLGPGQCTIRVRTLTFVTFNSHVWKVSSSVTGSDFQSDLPPSPTTSKVRGVAGGWALASIFGTPTVTRKAVHLPANG